MSTQTVDVSLLPEMAAVWELGREPVYLERNGQPYGVVVSPELYRRWAQRGDRFFAVMDEVGARNLSTSPRTKWRQTFSKPLRRREPRGHDSARLLGNQRSRQRALLHRCGIPRQSLDLARKDEIEVVVSPGTLEELFEVLRRPHIVSRYGITDMEVEEFIQGLRDFALVAPGELSLDVVVSDPKDNHVLAAAVETRRDFLVTGDKHLLTLALFESLRIVKPRDLLDNLHYPEP